MIEGFLSLFSLIFKERLSKNVARGKKGAKNENHIFYFENEKSTKHVLRRNRIGHFFFLSFFFPREVETKWESRNRIE